MDYKTYNYSKLEEEIKTEHEASLISDITFEPSTIIERVSDLMSIFAELYLDTNKGHKLLAEELHCRPHIVTSLFFSIFEQLKDVEQMLNECQEFKLPSKTA